MISQIRSRQKEVHATKLETLPMHVVLPVRVGHASSRVEIEDWPAEVLGNSRVVGPRDLFLRLVIP